MDVLCRVFYPEVDRRLAAGRVKTQINQINELLDDMGAGYRIRSTNPKLFGAVYRLVEERRP